MTQTIIICQSIKQSKNYPLFTHFNLSQMSHKKPNSHLFTNNKFKPDLLKSKSKNFINNKQQKEKSAFLVISDSSDVNVQQEHQSNQKHWKPNKDQVIDPAQLQIHNDHNVTVLVQQPQEGLSPALEQKPIHARTYEQRLNLLSQPQPKSSKKIKLTEQSPQQAVIIKFNAPKASLQAQSLDSQDMQKLQRVKQKKAYPWLSRSTKEIEDVCLRFHNEVVEFYDYVRPSKRQHQTRLQIFNLVKTMITQKYPTAKVQYFGSFATKLYLPDGDIDITVLIQEIQQYEERSVYDAINKIVRKHQGSLFCDIQYIRNSKVPLIKLVHIDTQLPFDISVNKRDGLNQVEHVKRMRNLYPQFQPMVFVLKTMLKVRNMSETYTGGVGSFLLFCMILHFLRYVHKKEYYYTMGEYIMKFMEFYAINGDWERKSVYVADSSQVGRAREPGTLSFYSPQDDSHDIGKSAFKIRDVFNVFKNRFRVIAGKNFKQGESILKELINPSGEQFRYYKYEKAMHKKVSSE